MAIPEFCRHLDRQLPYVYISHATDSAVLAIFRAARLKLDATQDTDMEAWQLLLKFLTPLLEMRAVAAACHGSNHGEALSAHSAYFTQVLTDSVRMQRLRLEFLVRPCMANLSMTFKLACTVCIICFTCGGFDL